MEYKKIPYNGTVITHHPFRIAIQPQRAHTKEYDRSDGHPSEKVDEKNGATLFGDKIEMLRHE